MGFLRRAFGRGDRDSGARAGYERCGHCGRDIRVGDGYVAVTLSRERFDGGAVTVEGSEVLLLLCSPYGGRLDAGALGREMRGAIRRGQPGGA